MSSQKEVAKKYKQFKINKQPSFREMCFPESYQLQKPQQFVEKFMGPDTNNKGILLFHRIGGGKTCAAVRIAEAWKSKRQVIFVVPASLVGNMYKELRSECTGNEYITSVQRKRLNQLDPLSKEYTNYVKMVNKTIDKTYKIYSYHKFVEAQNKLKLDNSVLIIDEVQNIVSEKGLFYNSIYTAIKEAPPSLRVVIMSATPIFDKPIEIALTMNLLRPKEPFPVKALFNETFIERVKGGYKMKNKKAFQDHIQGLISYYKGAPEYTFPERQFKVVRCPMSNFQWQCYQAVENQMGSKSFKDILKLPNNFLIGPRIISNVAFPNRQTGKDGLESFSGSAIDKDNLAKYSIKFCKIMGKLSKVDGTAFVYSNFKEYGGIMAFIKVLENRGYKDLTKHGVGKNRYALWSGDESPEQKETIRSVFNSSDNKKGEMCKVILGTPAIREGVSLFRVRQVHIIEPYWNISRMEQVIGRAVRFCSHKDLPKEERTVKIYQYVACPPENIKKRIVDEYIYDMAVRKEKLIQEFYEVMKKSAVDYELFN